MITRYERGGRHEVWLDWVGDPRSGVCIGVGTLYRQAHLQAVDTLRQALAKLGAESGVLTTAATEKRLATVNGEAARQIQKRLGTLADYVAREICAREPDPVLTEVWKRLRDLHQDTGPKVARRAKWVGMDWGRSNKEIAFELGVTPEAVGYQRRMRTAHNLRRSTERRYRAVATARNGGEA